MRPSKYPQTAPFTSHFFPLHLSLITIGDNLFPLGYWTIISKEPFRFLISMGVGNYSLQLLKKYKEAAIHFMPWGERDRVVQAGYLSGRDVNKAQALGFELIPAAVLQHTKIIQGADSVFETTVHMELMNLSREFLPFVLNVVHVHSHGDPMEHQPILFYSQEEFATTGDRWTYEKK